MSTAVVLIFFAGVGVGGTFIAALIYLRHLGHQLPGGLPPASPRAIARAARRSKLDLRPARDAGVRYVFRADQPRTERDPAALQHFDEDASHGH